MLGRGLCPRGGAPGLALLHPRCRWEPLQPPPPMAVGIIKAETRGEAAGRRGAAPSHPPPLQTEKIQTETRLEGERGGRWRGEVDHTLLKPQTPGGWCECPSNILPLPPKIHPSPPCPSPKSVLPGLCKMRLKTSWGEGRELMGRPLPAPRGPTQNGYSWLGSRDPPQFRRKVWRETPHQVKSPKRPED